MLILGRKQGEVIVIGPDITIKVLDITRSSVRIGIDAPRSIDVYREELLDDSGMPRHRRGVKKDSESGTTD